MSNHLSDARKSWQRASKFREHLSFITVAPNTIPIEKSQFSPDSPPPIPSLPHMPSTSTSQSWHKSPRNLEAGMSPSTRPGGFADRIRSMIFHARAWGREPEMVPIQEPHLGQWPPLHIEKKPCHCQDPKTKKRRRWWIIALIVLLLYLLANTVILNVRVLTIPSTSLPPGQITSTSTVPDTASTPSAPSTSTALSDDAQQCLSQFTLNGPSSPSSYPCSTCLSVLEAVPSNFSQTNPQDAQGIQNAIQFCGLKAIFDSTDSTGQTSLANGNWVQDVKFCAWTGVSCDGSGLVSAIQLTFPAVPASIPAELGGLTGLQNFQVVGNGAIPGGSLPSSFTNLTSMSTLHLESTGMTALPDNLFSALKKVASLTLVKNIQFEGGLPSTISGLSLQSLIINNQNLSTSLSSLLSSSSLQSSIQFIDLSSTGLASSIPSSISSFTSLTELHLDNNNLQPPLPTFPSSLQILTVANNTALSGALPSSLCTSSTLQTCDMRGTGLGNNGNCGPCLFS